MGKLKPRYPCRQEQRRQDHEGEDVAEAISIDRQNQQPNYLQEECETHE